MNPLLAWALERRDQLSFSVTEIRGLERFGLFDYCAELTWLGHRCKGRGTDHQAELALAKAISESLEAAMIRHYGLANSNGVAAHPELQEAKRLSCFELLERDLWLCHYLTKAPFYKLGFENPLHNDCAKNGVVLGLYASRSNERGRAFMALARGDRAAQPFGVIVGLGFAKPTEELFAAEKAWAECARSLLHVLGSPWHELGALSLKQLSMQPKYTPELQGRWALSLEALAGLFPWIDCEVDSEERPLSSHADSETYRVLLNPEDRASFGTETGEAPPLYVVQCLNPKLQSLHFGKSTAALVSLDRLTEFSGRRVLWEEVNPLPHPLA